MGWYVALRGMGIAGRQAGELITIIYRCRNYHGYLITDRSDGALFNPKDASVGSFPCLHYLWGLAQWI